MFIPDVMRGLNDAREGVWFKACLLETTDLASAGLCVSESGEGVRVITELVRWRIYLFCGMIDGVGRSSRL